MQFSFKKSIKTGIILSAVCMASVAHSAELRIGLETDPDLLDTDQSYSYIGRVVFTTLCDKLVDISPDLKIMPQLATEWSFNDDNTILYMKFREGVKFHDGTPFNAEAVKYNILRSMNLPESRRKTELVSIKEIKVTDDLQLEIHLKKPDVAILAHFADRSGMMISPTEAEKAGQRFFENPVCSGPFKFSERVYQDKIVFDKFEDYWNAENIHFDRITYLSIIDPSVRLTNLASGDLNMISGLAATDIDYVNDDPDLKVVKITGLGYQGITINVGNGDRANHPLGQSAALRRAFNMAINREVINEVVFDSQQKVGNQPFPPGNIWYNDDYPVQDVDIEKARQIVVESGYDRVPVELVVTNTPINLQLVQVIQSMVKPVGFDVTIKSMEFATLISNWRSGDFEIIQIGWSGRIDPDGNIHGFVVCDSVLNYAGYCDKRVDEALNAARTTSDFNERKAYYDAARSVLNEDLPLMYFYHQSYIWGLNNQIDGFVSYPDGMIRLENVKFK